MSARLRCLMTFAIFLLSTIFAAAQNVDNNNIFELDGNPQDSATPGEDWTKYFNVLHPAPPFGTGAALAKNFVAEAGNITTFTTGGSKDTLGISMWRHTNGSVPDKDDIQNAYAAAYNVEGHLLLYFGADRTANNGDANIGVWFFQSNVGVNTDGTFSGTHQDGDIFIVSGFTSGGQTSEIDVYEWSCPGNPSNCDAVGSLNLITSTTAAQCTPSSGGSHLACAITNTGDVTSVWAYTPKQGTTGTFPVASFFEGGINVTDLLGTTPCISSFIVETRSSTSNTAQLKDFIRGSFSLCGLSLAKSCGGSGTVNSGGTTIHYKFNGTVTNTGVGTVDPVTLVDILPSGATNATFKKGTAAIPPSTPGAADTSISTTSCPSDASSSSVCTSLGSLSGSAVVNWLVEYDVASVSTTNNAYAQTSVVGTIVKADTDEATCSTEPTNTVTVTKSCGVPAAFINSEDTSLPETHLVTNSGVAAVQVNFSGQVCNTGQTPLTNVTLTDSPAATINITWPGTTGALPAGTTGNCAKYTGSYLPSGVTAGDLGGVAGRYAFQDEIKVTGATATLGNSPGHDVTCTSTFSDTAQACASANCHVCPAGTCVEPEQ